MNIVAGHIQGDKTLEEERPTGPGRRKEDEEASSGAAIRHHVQNSAELGGLFEVARSISI